MDFIGPLAVIVGAMLAMSGFIVSKKPNAKELLDKITPYQGFIGVGLLGWGLVGFFHHKVWTIMDMLDYAPGLYALTIVVLDISMIILGFLLGMGLIAKWIPGESAAETKAVELQKKVMNYQLPIGLVGLVAALFALYYKLAKSYPLW